MRRKVADTIAAARALIKSPSRQDLPDEVLRLLVHRAIEKYTVFAVNKKPDFLTNDSLIELTYDADAMAYEFALDVSDTVRDIHTVKMFYQLLDEDPNTSAWCEVSFVKYKNYPQASTDSRVVACMFGNEYDGLSGKRIRINKTEDWVSQYRFRIGFRVVLSDKLDYDDYVPFPQEHSELIVDDVANEAITLVSDMSPEYQSFAAKQGVKLFNNITEKKALFAAWLDDDIDSVTTIIGRPFNYRLRNKLKGSRVRPYRIQE